MTMIRSAAGLIALTCLVQPVAARAAAQAQPLGSQVTSLLGDASDRALDQLAAPGAFYADQAVRILLPGPLKQAAGILALTDKAGLTGNLSRGINDAAGLAAAQAKPIFRAAIGRITLKDAVGIVGQGDGGSRYLQQSAGGEIRTKLRPLILAALTKVGAFRDLDRLGRASSLLARVGVSRDGLTDSVTDQAISGIFKYMGNEERKVRANPVEAVGGLLKL